MRLLLILLVAAVIAQFVLAAHCDSEAWINAAGGTLSLAGVGYSLWNLRVQRRIGRAREKLWQVREATRSTGRDQLLHTQLVELEKAGILEGLVVSAIGGVISSFAHPLFLLLG